jgi:hypothetical protein
MTDVPEQVRVALARAFFSQGPEDEGRRLQALLEVLALAAAGNPVPSPATVRAGSLVCDCDENWRAAQLVGELGVFASDPVAENLVFLPWHRITAFARLDPPPGAEGRRREPVVP